MRLPTVTKGRMEVWVSHKINASDMTHMLTIAILQDKDVDNARKIMTYVKETLGKYGTDLSALEGIITSADKDRLREAKKKATALVKQIFPDLT